MNATVDPRGMTVLATKHPLVATKRFTWHPTGWIKKSYDRAREFYYGSVWDMAGIDDLADAVQQIAANPRNMVIRGALTVAAYARIAANPHALVRRLKHTRDGIEPDFIEVPRQWLMVDVDDFQLRTCDDLVDDPEGAVAYAIGEMLPECFQDVRCFWQLSASAGFSPGMLKVHLFYWLDRPLIDADLKKTLEQHAPRITDLSVYQGVQPHYIASPIIEGAPDPIARRFGWIDGQENAVALPSMLPDAPRAAGAIPLNGGPLGLGNDPLGRLGDGDGLAGFHLPLRSAALAYALRTRAGATRDDVLFIAACNRAIDAAPRKPDRQVSDYRDGDYLARSIAGAFDWLADREQQARPAARKAVARLIFEMIRRQASQADIEAAAFAEGERVGLSREGVLDVAHWVAREAD